MLSRRSESALLIAVLAGVGALSWSLLLRPVTDSDPTRFAALPGTLNGWESIELEIDESVSEMLAADQNVQRA